MFSLPYFFSLVRIVNLLIAMLAILITFYILEYPLSSIAGYIIMVVLSCMASGYIMNDLLDVQSDIINKKSNYIANNIITKCQAHCINILFIVMCIYASLYINFKAQLILYFLLIPILLAYNFILKKFVFIGNFFIAALLSFIFLFTELIITGGIGQMYVIALFAFFLNFIREIIKDIHDRLGDQAKNMKTFPIIFGVEKSILFVKIAILFFGIILLIHSYICSVYFYFPAMIILVEIPLIYSLFLLSRSYSKKTIYRVTILYKAININGLFVIILMKEIF